MAAPLDPEQRRKVEEALMRKAQDIVRELRRMAECADTEGVERSAGTMTELLKTKEFPSQRATEFREAVKRLQCNVFQLSVDSLLHQAERRGHAGDDKGRNEFLTKAKDHFAKAMRYGADADFRGGVERRVQAALMTSADGVDERTKKANAHKLEMRDTGPKPPNGIERRRSIRYMDPVLKVNLSGLVLRTVNWSIRGMLLEPYRPEFQFEAGMRLKLDISCTEVAPERGGRQLARVIRIDKDRAAFAVEFPDISTVVIDLVRALKDAGIRPEPER